MREEFEIPEEEMEKIKNPEVIKLQQEEGKTLQEVMGYDQEKMEKFYHAAHQLYQRQEYQKAADAFIFLTTLNPFVHNYWLGLGMSEQLSGGYSGALLAYAMAIMNDMSNPVPHYHSATCYQELGETDSAVHSLEMAIECAAKEEGYESFLEAASSFLEKIRPQSKP